MPQDRRVGPDEPPANLGFDAGARSRNALVGTDAVTRRDERGADGLPSPTRPAPNGAQGPAAAAGVPQKSIPPELLRARSTYVTQYAPLFDHSDRMRGIRRCVELVADTDAAVLLCGESGTGKDVVARAIHFASGRCARPFVKVNCAALPADLLESELFGHEKGAFTGAFQRKPGTFELAHTGTIVLDEIGDMSIALQPKLLHALQDREFVRVGGSDTTAVDVRVIASTNQDLEAAVRAGRFREDLYYRLKVITLHLPPLRERRSEIPVLAQAFVQRFNEQYRRELCLSQDSLDLLTQYSWPGNVRELENMMRRIVVLQNEQLLQEELQALTDAGVPSPPRVSPPHGTLRDVAKQAATDAERRIIADVLERVHWNRAEAARHLGIGYKALLYKMNRCGLSAKRPRVSRRSDDGGL
jgi:two-component system response regulator AtoC